MGSTTVDYLKTIIPVGMYTMANSYYSIGANDPAEWKAWIGIGRGLNTWTRYEVPTPPDTKVILHDEIARMEPVWSGYLVEADFDNDEITYSPTQTLVLRYVVEFPSDTLSKLGLTGMYLKEYGLFMDGMHLQDTGDACLMVNHSRIWWADGVRLRREIIMDLRG
jgi:hypothetical protein